MQAKVPEGTGERLPEGKEPRALRGGSGYAQSGAWGHDLAQLLSWWDLRRVT